MKPAESNGALLATDKLAKEYRGRRVVNGVSVDVRAGEIVGLLGPNGAGKTTTFNMVVGVVKPDEGWVKFQDHKITTMPMHLRARHLADHFILFVDNVKNFLAHGARASVRRANCSRLTSSARVCGARPAWAMPGATPWC